MQGTPVMDSLTGAIVVCRQQWRRVAIAAALSFPLVLLMPGPAVGQVGMPSQLGQKARAQIGALVAEKASRTPAQQKIDSRILHAIDAQRPVPRLQLLKSLYRPLAEADGKVTVDIDLFDGNKIGLVIAALRQARAEIVFSSARFKSIRARLNPLDVEAIAAQPNVRFVDSKREADTNKNNTSEGDAVHRANVVRSTLGYTGAGQKLCALSSGVDSLAARQATGDLPAVVQVLPGQAGKGDEGTAMLEIMHDLAPEAQLGFATTSGGEAAFAQNILDLADPVKGGCTIVVDDTDYYSESPFQDGTVAQAVNTVTAAGIVYFSAAANSGNFDSGSSGTWEGDFSAPSGMTNALIPGQTLHEFIAGVAGNAATSPAPRVFMHWAEPFGAAASDYDLYVLDPTLSEVLGSSTNTQNGTQNPTEYIEAPSGMPFPVGSRVLVAKKTGAQNLMFNLQWYRGTLTYSTSGATRGHSTAVNALSIAATPAGVATGTSPPNPTGPFPNPFGASSQVEIFSSDGPRRIFFDGNGNLLPGAPAGNFTASGGVVRNKPDITAADGVATDTPGFNRFFGTSAAAPHAAAIAALVKQAFPAWTVQQVRNALTGSALDILSPGWDRNSGAGIVMPLAALQVNGAPAIAALNLANVVPAEVNGNGNGLPDSGEDWKFGISLGNSGGVTGTGVIATLYSNTPGVVVTSGPVAYATVPVNGSVANPAANPFRFSVFDIACGQNLQFTLRVTVDQNPLAFDFPIHMPSNLALGAPQTFSYTGGSVAIPDGTPGGPGHAVTLGLAVSGVPATVGTVSLRINGLNSCAPNDATTAGVEHSYVGDLVIGLKGPDGTLVNVINRMAGGNNDGRNICNTILDDQASADPIGTISRDLAPFTGSFKPDSPLSAFMGKSPNGMWELQATDFVESETGNINAFSVVVSPQACVRVAKNVSMTATKTVSGAFVLGGLITYTVTLTNTGNGAQADNPGDEYVDVLPSQLTLVPGSTTASSGVITSAGNTVRWNGALDAGSALVLTIRATINQGTTGMQVSSQGTASYDASHSGVNNRTLPTDDPGVAGAANPTVFVVGAMAPPPTAYLDVDANDSADALTDGLIVLRYLFGITDTAMVNGAVGAGAQRASSSLIAPYLDGIRFRLDADDDGNVDALTDGLLILRYLFGLRGPELVANAVSAGAARKTAAQIDAYLQTMMP
jgi:uncharacterized repeat protein (TIGR01451 family)